MRENVASDGPRSIIIKDDIIPKEDEMPEEAKVADESAETDESKNEETPAPEDDFDKDRALKTIRAQREEEKRLKAELAKYKAEEEAELEKQKSLEQKLAERDASIQQLEGRLANQLVEQSFKEEAREKGIADPELAFLAAEKAGLLGDYDPETGKVGAHNFDELSERFPTFEPKEAGTGPTGDAGRRGGVSGKTPADSFNESVRSAMRRRL
jgi:hypothetical protein